MTPKDAIRREIEGSYFIVRSYVDDLADADLFVRSVPGANHIAWQLGHLIAGTRMMLASVGCKVPDLPKGFEEMHSAETAAIDDPARFETKAEYLALAEQARDAALAAVDATPDSRLDDPAPESMREYAPTVGAVLLLSGSHWLMHAGQFVPIRRRLGKPPLF
jgi:hypothetical protein